MITKTNHEMTCRTTVRRSIDNSDLPTNVSNFLDIRIEGSFRSKSLRMPEIPPREGINALQG